MCCLYPFLIAGDCKVVLREINTLLLSSPTCSMPAHLVYRWPFNNNFQYRNFFNCLFRFLLQTTVVGLLMGKAEQMDFVWCVSAERKNERAQNHLNDKSNLKRKKKKYFSLCNNLLSTARLSQMHCLTLCALSSAVNRKSSPVLYTLS